MFEITFVLGLFIALVWMVVHAFFMLVSVDSQDDVPARPGDPIATYIKENYGSHFHPEPPSAGRSTRHL